VIKPTIWQNFFNFITNLLKTFNAAVLLDSVKVFGGRERAGELSLRGHLISVAS